MDGRKRRGRKLLIATLGVAAVSYVGCGDDDRNPTVANLVAPPDSGGSAGSGGASGSGGSSGMGAKDGSPLDVVANLVAPPDVTTDVRSPRDGSVRDVVANLVAPDLGLE